MYSVVAHQNYGRERRDNRQQTQQHQHGQSSQPHHHHHHHHQQHHHQQHHHQQHHHHHGQNLQGGGSDGVGSVGGSGGGAGAGGTGDCTSRGPTGQQHYHPDGKRRSQRHRNLSITGRFLNYLKRRFNPVQEMLKDILCIYTSASTVVPSIGLHLIIALAYTLYSP